MEKNWIYITLVIILTMCLVPDIWCWALARCLILIARVLNKFCDKCLNMAAWLLKINDKQKR